MQSSAVPQHLIRAGYQQRTEGSDDSDDSDDEIEMVDYVPPPRPIPVVMVDISSSDEEEEMNDGSIPHTPVQQAAAGKHPSLKSQNPKTP
eukprot:2622001-Pyramimonas_sp.AAC.1